MWNTLVLADTGSNKQLLALLSNFHSMTAEFQQTVYNEQQQPLQQNQGKMALLRPGKFRWEVTTPNSQLMLTDGKQVWIYDTDLNQATHQLINMADSVSPAALLSNEASQLPQRFFIKRLKATNSQTVFQLKPKKTDDLFKYVILYFQQQQLTQMRIIDNLGSLSVFNFEHVELNKVLNTNLFIFKPPKGITVIENN